MPEIKKINIELSVNGKSIKENVEPRLLLVDFLRYNLNLTGTHIGCDTSQCGSCTIHVENKCVKSCSILAIQCHKKEITTVEGLSKPGSLHDVQKFFRKNHGLQCGFCTPGILFSAIELEKDKNIKSENQIRKFLDGNLCRCTGYQNIIKSIVSFINNNNN